MLHIPLFASCFTSPTINPYRPVSILECYSALRPNVTCSPSVMLNGNAGSNCSYLSTIPSILEESGWIGRFQNIFISNQVTHHSFPTTDHLTTVPSLECGFHNVLMSHVLEQSGKQLAFRPGSSPMKQFILLLSWHKIL